MSGETSENTSAPRKWLGPVLLISLVINLFLVAAVTVGFVRNMGPDGRGHVSPLGLPHHVVARSLTGEERDMLKAVMRENRAELRPLFGELRQARLALSAAVAADPYDPEATKAAFAAMRTGMDAMATRSQDVLVEAFADLTPESRARVAEALKRGPRRGGRRERPPAVDGSGAGAE